MQTTGALLGIFLAIYVLAIPRLLNLGRNLYPEKLVGLIGRKEKREEIEASFEAIRGLEKLNMAFILIIISCCLTIVLSTLWLDSLTTNLLITSATISGLSLGYLAICFFLLSVSIIGFSSILIIHFVVKLFSPKYMYKGEKNKRNV